MPKPSLGELKAACQSNGQQLCALLDELRKVAAARLVDRGQEGPTPTLVLPLDQAEELFSAGAREAPEFIAALTQLLERMNSVEVGLIVAATIRTDRFEVMQQHPVLGAINTVLFDRLKPMPATQFREVITAPAERTIKANVRVTIEPDLADRLLEDATGGADTLPLLSLTLARLYHDFKTDGELTLAQYEAMGGMGEIVNREIGEILSHDLLQRITELELLRSAFPWLVTINADADSERPLRRAARYSELPEASRPLIDALVAKRLMVKDTREGEVVIEVALEGLLGQWDEMADWIEEQHSNLKTVDDVERNATNWEKNHCDPAWLLTGNRLTAAVTLAASPEFSQRLGAMADYLSACREAERLRLKARPRRASGIDSVQPLDWDDLLGHIRQQVLVPVVGPDVTVVNVGDTEQTFTSLIGQRLAERYHLTLPPGMTTMDEAVAAFLRERGHDEVDRVYRVINDIIEDYPAPGDALRDLAAITDLRLFVSETPDRLLAQAVNEVRFQGRPATRELSFFPNQSISEQLRNAQPAARTETVVLNLFGQAASTAQYAIHEEDRLEWLQALLSDTASLPDWLAYPLKHYPMLFIGCEISEWLGPLLLPMLVSDTRRSIERKQFFFVGSSTSDEPSLASFLATNRRKPLVQRLDMDPSAFVAELRARWEEQSEARPRAAVDTTSPSAPDAPTIFISYVREDVDAARRLCDAISTLGGDVWLDERRLSPGDAWEDEILTHIRRTIKLFVSVISANTERAEEGAFFREWTEAVDRSRSILGHRFIVPVIVDEDYEGDPSRYRQIPDEFGRFQFGRAPGGEPDAELLAVLIDEIRAMRRPDAP